MNADRLPRGAVALFGGTFDPVHAGHVAVALDCHQVFELAGVVFVPAKRSPHKDGTPEAADVDRLALLQVAIGSDPRLEVWDTELRRPAPSYSIDTVKAYRRLWLKAWPGEQRPTLAWILGDDQLAGLPRWHMVEELFSSVWPIVVQRSTREGFEQHLAALERRLSPELLARLRAGALPLAQPHPASATEIRRRLAAGDAVGDWLPPGVEQEIRARGLYGAR